MCSNLWSHVQNTNAFSYALLWRVVYSSHFYCLTSRSFGALSIFTGKADTKDFAVLVFTGNAPSKWIWSDNFWSRDSALPIAVGEKHRLYNNNKSWLLAVVMLYISGDTKSVKESPCDGFNIEIVCDLMSPLSVQISDKLWSQIFRYSKRKMSAYRFFANLTCIWNDKQMLRRK